MKKVTAIIQSSWKSKTGLEYKSLIRLSNGKTVLETIVNSLRKMDAVDKIVLATSNTTEDKKLIAEAKRIGIDTYAGELDNILGRLKKVCLKYSGVILKIDGNKPLLDPVEGQNLIHDHISNNYEYSYNGHYYGVIYGTDCEVFNSSIFNKVDDQKLTASQQESGTIHIRANPHNFNIYAKKFRTPRPDYRVILETKNDIDVINSVLKNVHTITNEALVDFFGENPIISSHNRVESAREVGFNKVMLFPEKLRAIHDTGESGVDSSYPISIEMSFTNRCNFKCIWCSDKKLRARQEDDMSIFTIKKLAKDLAKHETKGVTIEGGGESTIVPYFSEAVEAFKNEGLSLGLITNGSVRFADDIINQFDWIRVSLDASCREEMKILKGSNDYDRIINNIIHFTHRKPVVGIGYVATNRNISHVESLLLRIRETGISYIQFRPVIDHPELKPQYDFEYLKKYQSISFSVITDGMKENIIKGNNGIGCRCHSLSTVVTADGSVYLCGRLNIYPWIKPIGNINKKSFYEIWNGKERKKQANTVRDSNFCLKYCPECRIAKFNIELDRLGKIRTKNFI